MKKPLLGLGICLIAGIVSYFTVRSWVYTQAIKAIELATESKAEVESMSLDLFAGRVNLHRGILTPRKPSTLWEQITVMNASGQIRWRERNAGIIPMEVTINECSIMLRQREHSRLPKEQIHFPALSSPSAPNETSTKDQIVLTALTVRNIKIFEETNKSALVGGIDCTARRGIAGWQGKVTAAHFGSDTLPLTNVQIGFSAETPGTRVTEFRCNIKEGMISGSGWYSDDGLAALDFQVDSLSLASIAPAWCNTVSGVVSGSFNYKGNPFSWGEGIIAGNFTLKDGVLKLDALSQMLSLLGGATEGDALQLDSATATLTLTPQDWTLSQISMKKKNFFEIDGTLNYGQGARLKADLKLGISKRFAPSIGQSGARDRLDENFNWTSLSLETTPDQLWQGILASWLTPAQSINPAQQTSQKSALKGKAKAAADTIMNILTQ